MAWVYESAYQDGQTVRVILRLDDPLRPYTPLEKLEYMRYPQETVQEFIARARRDIASRLGGMNTRYQNEINRTEQFRPPSGAGPGA